MARYLELFTRVPVPEDVTDEELNRVVEIFNQQLTNQVTPEEGRLIDKVLTDEAADNAQNTSAKVVDENGQVLGSNSTDSNPGAV